MIAVDVLRVVIDDRDTGLWRLCEVDGGTMPGPLCNCIGDRSGSVGVPGHPSPDAALYCPWALAERDRRNGFGDPSRTPHPSPVAVVRRRPDARITAMHGHRSTGDADGVWLHLPTGLVWMAPDAAESLAACLTRAAADCKAARLVPSGEEPVR